MLRYSVFLLAVALNASAAVDSALLSLLPSDSPAIAGIDVAKAGSSEFGRFLLNKARSDDAHFQEFMTETGFDPRRDLQSVLFAVKSAGSRQFAIVARGNFDVNRLKTLAVNKGAKTQSFQGVEMLVHGGSQTAVSFPDVGIAAMADLATMKQIIAQRAAPAVLEPTLQRKIDAVSSANDFWFASNSGFLPVMAADMSQASGLKGIVGSAAGIQFGPKLVVTVDAETRSEKDASSLTDVIRFMTSAAQMNRAQDSFASMWATAFDTMVLKTTGTTVHCSFSILEKALEQLKP